LSKSSFCLQLSAIAEELHRVQMRFPEINAALHTGREDFSDVVLDNLLDAYDHLNELIKKDFSPFSEKGIQEIFALNSLVLGGGDAAWRKTHARFLQASWARFLEMVVPLVRWYHKHKDENPFKVAAEMYVGVLSHPQLFMEGNHRTGTLIASWILLKHGKPPFVLTVENAKTYFDPSAEIKFTDKRNVNGQLKLPKYKRYFRDFLEAQVKQNYLFDEDCR
jgi:hypothetical protein